MNVKRVRRLWIELGLRRPLRLRKPRKRGPKPGVGANSCVNQPARFKNDVWTCDFIHDRTADGRPLKWLTLVDEYTRECLVLHAAGTITGADVRRILARVIGRRGGPTRIRSDNGSEFVCDVLVKWLPAVRTTSIPVAAASPWQNGYVESFHSRLRDEFLEREQFENVQDAHGGFAVSDLVFGGFAVSDLVFGFRWAFSGSRCRTLGPSRTTLSKPFVGFVRRCSQPRPTANSG